MGSAGKSAIGSASEGCRNATTQPHTAARWRCDTITYRRAELYEQVWAEPVRVVAKRYGVSDVALGTICRKPGRAAEEDFRESPVAVIV